MPGLWTPLLAPARWALFDLNATTQSLFRGGIVLLGWAIRNVSTVATAAMDISDSQGDDSAPIFPINLAANESNREWFGDRGVLFRNGLFLDVTAGEIKGAVLYRQPHSDPDIDAALVIIEAP